MHSGVFFLIKRLSALAVRIDRAEARTRNPKSAVVMAKALLKCHLTFSDKKNKVGTLSRRAEYNPAHEVRGGQLRSSCIGTSMRKPETIERVYMDFDGFFASVESFADKRLRGRPVGVVPFEGTTRTAIIACSREAKMRGVKNVMPVEEAKRLCPDIVLVPQKPDLYRRAHNALLSEIEAVIPIDTAKSIDELTCKLDETARADPEGLARKVKDAIFELVGPWITCSMGFAANRQLAKMACKESKRSGTGYGNGVAIWRPEAMPAPLLAVNMEDIPGVGDNMAKRLYRAGIFTTEQLYSIQPKHMRKLWGNVTGERMWYALHGYDIQAPASKRGMFGHV